SGSMPPGSRSPPTSPPLRRRNWPWRWAPPSLWRSRPPRRSSWARPLPAETGAPRTAPTFPAGNIRPMSSLLPEPLTVAPTAPDRNLALELVRVTEAAAMAAAPWVGRGGKHGAVERAVNAMRVIVSIVSMNVIVVIGEGEEDEAPMLFTGEH